MPSPRHLEAFCALGLDAAEIGHNLSRLKALTHRRPILV